jgi:hypothetical protein
MELAGFRRHLTRKHNIQPYRVVNIARSNIEFETPCTFLYPLFPAAPAIQGKCGKLVYNKYSSSVVMVWL